LDGGLESALVSEAHLVLIWGAKFAQGGKVMATIAVVRQAVEKVAGVSKTWFEWTMEKGDFLKTLVVEVSFDTDPNSEGYNQSAIEEIGRVTKDALANQTTMVVSYLRIIPA
jgi:hypothetical protein